MSDTTGWLPTTEVLSRAMIHRKTLALWLCRKVIPPPELVDGVRLWHPSVVSICINRVAEQQRRQQKKKRKPTPPPAPSADAERLVQVLAWWVSRYVASCGGSLPLAGASLNISKRRLQELVEKYDIVLHEDASQVYLRVAQKPWTKPINSSTEPSAPSTSARQS